VSDTALAVNVILLVWIQFSEALLQCAKAGKARRRQCGRSGIHRVRGTSMTLIPIFGFSDCTLHFLNGNFVGTGGRNCRLRE